MLDTKLDLAFEHCMLQLKQKSTDLYTQVKNYERTNNLKHYFYKEIKEYIYKRTKRGLFDTNQQFLNKTMENCFELLLVSMQKHYDNNNMSHLAKKLKEEADNYAKDLESSAVTGELHGDFKELDGVVEVPRLIDDDKTQTKGVESGNQENRKEESKIIY